MNITGYLIGLAALVLVLWNMRRHELTNRRLRRPLLIAGIICAAFLHGVPMDGADGVLVTAGIITGGFCGVVSALATRLEREPSGTIMATGTPLAVAVTGVAFAARLAFAFAVTHGLGPAVTHFSAHVGIHSQQAWVASLVLMAASDLVVRAGVLRRRRDRLAAAHVGTPAAVAAVESPVTALG